MWVDTGNWSDTYTPEGAVKTKTLLSAMADMGYAAANISEREVAAGYESFLALKKESKVPIVSANVVFQSSGKPIVQPYVIVTLEPKKYPVLKKPLKIAIAGVTRFNPAFLKSAPPKDNVIIANPQDELKKYLPEMRKKADQVIVLAAMTKDDAHVLAKTVPGIDIIMGGYGGYTTAVEEKEGSTAIFYCGTQGKYLGEIRVYQADNLTQHKSSIHYLNTQYPEDATMKAKVDQAVVEINNLGKAIAEQLAKPAQGSAASLGAAEQARTFLGVESCKGCHPGEYAVWTGSKHAQAMRTLVEKQSDFNADCVKCHVVGFGKPGGFVDAKSTAPLANVQCEACHGPAARHIDNPGAPYGRTGKATCEGCHTTERSPSFDFDVYWPKIKHGQ